MTLYKLCIPCFPLRYIHWTTWLSDILVTNPWPSATEYKIFLLCLLHSIIKFIIHLLNFLMFWNRWLVNMNTISTMPVREARKRNKCLFSGPHVWTPEWQFSVHNGNIKITEWFISITGKTTKWQLIYRENSST